MAVTRIFFESSVRLCCVDFGGNGPPAMMLHGLCGRGIEWRQTADWLCETHHVFALDQRGHGRSAKGVAMERAAFVDDVISAIQRLSREPVVLIGQSLGGVHAFLAAARCPQLVQKLVVVEATAWKDVADGSTLNAWFERWPVPFGSLAEARAWFSTQGLVDEGTYRWAN